jgi:hypothetical protein
MSGIYFGMCLREILRYGNLLTEDIRTTKDSAATRSRNSHIIQVKNALAVGWKLDSQ